MKFNTMIVLLFVVSLLLVGCSSSESRYTGAATYNPGAQPAPVAGGGCGVVSGPVSNGLEVVEVQAEL
jgi:hypothetical protein